MSDTIFALSSGAPPAAIGVIRVSGPEAASVLQCLAGKVPLPRLASYTQLRGADGELLDNALILWFPGPGTATGEDVAELHVHGGRAVVMAVEEAIVAIPKLRRATSGEFTRRAFMNGRIDLAEAEGLADLLSAETELQRITALLSAEGHVSSQVDEWRVRLLDVSAGLEAFLDFSDEDDVDTPVSEIRSEINALCGEIREWLDRPKADRLREGFKVVLAGEPNSGKSTLFNALVEHEAAITASVAGTTRDVLVSPVAIEGIPFQFMDTAGLRDEAGDEIEAIGVKRARAALQNADLVLWLGGEGEGPDGAWEIEAQADRDDRKGKRFARHVVSALTGLGMDGLRADLVESARCTMPRPGEVALNARQHALLSDALEALGGVSETDDPLIIAEYLRLARVCFDALLGRTTTEDMLDALFGRFCIGK